MKHVSYTCDFCKHPIENQRLMYSYRGEEYTWIFDYDNGLQLHQYCVKLFQEAKRLAEKAGQKAYEATRKKLAPKTKPEEKEEETNENW